MNELGKKIKQRREELGLSQDELARMLGYKHKSSINKIELGAADVPRAKVPAFAKALGMTAIEFSGWTEERKALSFSYCMEPAQPYSNSRALSSLMGILYCPLPYKAKEARHDAGLLSLVFHVFASDPERDRSGAQRTDGHDGDQYGHNQRFHGVLLS